MQVLRVSPHDLKAREPFKSLFPVQPQVQAAIKEAMEANGMYDFSKPIDGWEETAGEYTIVDGHTRWLAALEADVLEVTVVIHHFPHDQAALEYAIHNQRNRRNMTDADILRCVEVLDQRGREGRPTKTSRDQLVCGPSRDRTAETVGVSTFKVQQTRTVLDHAPEPVRDAVRDGQLSINAAYNQTQEQRRAEAPRQASFPTFNRTNDNIEWALWTWNPVTGCEHSCRYCYARDIATRFFPQGFTPTFHPERLSAPQHTKLPATAAESVGERHVFVCSMADLFGDWVPQEWIDAVLAEVRRAPQWRFIFLTKNPKRLATIDWPENTRVGTTVDVQSRVQAAEEAFRHVNAPIRFLSCEPLMERLTFSTLEVFDWVIVGGRSKNSQLPEYQPHWEWVHHLECQARAAGCRVYFKPNLTVRPREYPESM